MRKDQLLALIFILIALASITTMIVVVLSFSSEEIDLGETIVEDNGHDDHHDDGDIHNHDDSGHDHDHGLIDDDESIENIVPLCPELTDEERSQINDLYFQAKKANENDVSRSKVLKQIQDFGARAIPSIRDNLILETDEKYKESMKTLIEILETIPVKSENLLLLPGIEINTTRNYIRIEAKVAKIRDKDDIKNILTNNFNPDAKSLFTTDVSGKILNKAFYTIGAKGSSIRPEFSGDFRPYDGSKLKITIEYKKLGVLRNEMIQNLYSVVYDKVEEVWMSETYWIFLGGTKIPGQNNELEADKTGNLFSLYNSDSSALITNPWMSATSEDRFQGFMDKIPMPGESVYLKFEIVEDEKTKAQDEEVASEYETFQTKRDQILQSITQIPRSEPLVETFKDSVSLEQALNKAENSTIPQINSNMPKLLPDTEPEEVKKLLKLLDEVYKIEDEKVPEVIDEIKKFDCRYFDYVYKNANDNYSDSRSQKVLEASYTVADHSFQVGKVIFYHGIAIDTENKIIIADGFVPEIKDMPLEYIISGTNGKTYESLFVINALPYHLETAFERLGYKKSSQKPKQRGDWTMYDGDATVIEAAWLKENLEDTKLDPYDYADWKSNEKVHIQRVESLIKNMSTSRSMEKCAFPFVGSKSLKGDVYYAQEYGTVCGALSDTTTLLENPWFGAMIPHIYQAMSDLLPVINSPVRLFFTMEPQKDREERLKKVKEFWDKERLFRPFYHFDKLPGWELARDSGNILKYIKDESVLVVLVDQNSSKKFEITDEDIENWKQEASENSGFGRRLDSKRMKYKTCDAFMQLIEFKKSDPDDPNEKPNYIIIYHVRTLLHDYMVQFHLYQADLELIKATFNNIIEKRLTLGLPEQYPEEKSQTQPK